MLSKLVTVVVTPLGTAIALGCLGLLLQGETNPCAVAWSRGFQLAALLWLTLWSLPIVSESLRVRMEAQAGERTLARLPQASAMVVLGGGLSGPRPPLRPDPDLGRAADRMWYAARLYHAGKAPLLVLSGGVVRTGNGSEAQAMLQLLQDLGVPVTAMLVESESPDTASSVAHTVRLLRERGLTSPLLVTSALHMARARAQFEHAGMSVIPAPTDFEVINQPPHLLQWLPSGDALEGSGRAFKELLGQLISR